MERSENKGNLEVIDTDQDTGGVNLEHALKVLRPTNANLLRSDAPAPFTGRNLPTLGAILGADTPW